MGVEASVENPYVYPWGQLSAYRLIDESIMVDGVSYDYDKLRALVKERHTLATDLALWRGYAERRQVKIDQLEARLNRADTHLQRRTAALVRMIAKKGPRLDEIGPGHITIAQPTPPSERPVPTRPMGVVTRRPGWHRFGW